MIRFTNFVDAISASKLKSRAIIFCLGLFSALSFAPYFQTWLLFICLPLFIVITGSQQSSCSSFISGWWFGFGHFVAGLYWISISLLVEPEKFAWLIPFAVSLIPAILAMFTGLIAVALRAIKPAPAAVPFLFAALWGIGEWLRGHLFTGFPWNLIGYSWNSLEVLQSLSLAGIYGLGFFTALAAASPVVFILKNENQNKLKYSAPLLSVLILAAAFVYGVERLKENPTTYNENVGIRIVQPNIPETDRVNPAKRVEAVQKLVQISTKDLSEKTRIIVWPEAAIPFLIFSERDVPPEVWEVTKDDRYLVTGADRAVGEDWNNLKIWNSIFVLRENEIAAYYDKTKLVPFGEYIPFRKYLPDYINKVTPGAIDFSGGDGPKALEAEGMPAFLPLICYEVVYPDYVAAAQRSGNVNFLLMVNVTNDSWFGNSSGPYQHLAQTRARAIEQGVPVIRSANTGISAAFDAYGRMLVSAELGKPQVADILLPKKSTKPVVYSDTNDAPFWIALTIGFIVSYACSGKLSQKRKLV